MAEEIVELVTGSGISVMKEDGSFQPVPTPEGFTTAAFRSAVAAYDAAYRLNGSLPTVDDVHRFWPRIPKATYAKLFLTEEFADALRYRGVELEVDSGLSTEQAYALLSVTNWMDNRSLNAKLKELGIPPSRWEAWLNQPLFKESYRLRTERSFSNAESVALNAIMQGAGAGKIDAAKLLLEITGRWNPNAAAVEDAKAIVLGVVEAVVLEVKDPETRKRILDRIGIISGTMSAVNSIGSRPALES